MSVSILERLGTMNARSNKDEESQLERKSRKALNSINRIINKSKGRREARGGLYSMGARGVFVREGDLYSRRVVIKAKIRKNIGANFKENLRKHLDYITRDGAGKDRNKAELFSEDENKRDLKDIQEQFSSSPHNFRFIVSPEDSEKMNLKEFTKNLVSSMESDLKVKLDWVAAVHYDTNEPHIHLLVNGHDKSGNRLIMTRDYISNGVRNRASRIITNKLGTRDYDDVVKSINLDVNKSQKIYLDSIILKHLNDGVFNLKTLDESSSKDLPKFLFQKRLEYLGNNGLAHELEKGSWRLADGYLESLKQIDRSRSLVEKVSHGTKIDRSELIKADSLYNKPIQGEVIKRGYLDELNDTEYLVIKTKESKNLLVELEKYSEKLPAKVGEIVRVDTTKPFAGAKASDYTIDKEAKDHDQIYDALKHEANAHNRKLPPGVSAKEYVQVHINRLEVLARQGLVEKLSEGRFLIPKDFIEKLSEEALKSKVGYKPHVKVTRLKPAQIKKTPVLSRGPKL